MNPRHSQQQGGEQTADSLLQELLNRPMSERHRALDHALTERVPKIEELLPDFMKGQGERLVKRAMLTFSRNPDLQKCPPADFVRCVLEAAEMGFAVDGKMCYVVNYKGKYQCQLDYKGLVAVARRMKTIKDIYGDVVCENDTFLHRRRNGKSFLEHTYELGGPRGEVIGAYCVVILPDGGWRYEVMDRDALDRIQKRAPAKNGPWSSDPDEMRKKTVFRRCLKLYGDDPGLIRVLELTDELDAVDAADDKPASVEEMTAALTGRNGKRPQSAPRPQINGNGYEPEPSEHAAPPPEKSQGEYYDAGERPQTTREPRPDFLDFASVYVREAATLDAVDQAEQRLLGECLGDAECAAIEGLANQRRGELRAQKPAKQKSLA